MASVTVKAERFGTHGHKIETVDFTVNKLRNVVYVFIEGNGPVKQFVMSAEDWDKLSEQEA